MLKFHLPMAFYLWFFAIPLAGVLLAYLLLMPISGNFLAYLIWKTTPAAVPLKGNVKSEDVNIHYISYGTGPAILLLHGGLSNRLSWFSQIPWLVSSGHRVVLLDTRGHGESGLGQSEFTYRLLASDAVQVLNTLGLQQVDVIGWSDGGNTALMLGRYWSGRIRRIVAISANFNPAGLTPEAQQDMLDNQRNPLIQWITRWWTGAGEKLPDLEGRILRMWKTGPTLKSDDLRAISLPCLIIVGEHDVVSIEHAEQMADFLPNGLLQILPGGHSTPVTRAQLVNGLIGEFLNIPFPVQ